MIRITTKIQLRPTSVNNFFELSWKPTKTNKQTFKTVHTFFELSWKPTCTNKQTNLQNITSLA